jgi:hypothetical protein
MPSNRPAATWQSAAAIVPIARSRCATSTSPSADCSTQRGSADSKPTSSSLPSDAHRRSPTDGSSRTPFRVAPPPRVATHSSSGPKSCTKPNTTSAIVGPSATAIETQWCGSPRLALSEPSIGSTTTTKPSPPKSTVPRSSLTTVKRAPSS